MDLILVSHELFLSSSEGYLFSFPSVPPFKTQISSISDTGHFKVVNNDEEPANGTEAPASARKENPPPEPQPSSTGKTSLEIYGKLDRYGFIRQHSEPKLAIEVKKR